jgi:hypothetical protein
MGQQHKKNVHQRKRQWLRIFRLALQPFGIAINHDNYSPKKTWGEFTMQGLFPKHTLFAQTPARRETLFVQKIRPRRCICLKFRSWPNLLL